MSKIKFQSGNVSVELNDSVADAIQKVVDKVLPNTRRQIHFARIRRKWNPWQCYG